MVCLGFISISITDTFGKNQEAMNKSHNLIRFALLDWQIPLQFGVPVTKPLPFRLPRQWPDHVKSGILHAIALASTAMTAVHARTARRHRLRAELDQARNEIALLREELEIKDGRWLRSRSRRRPHYLPTQRLRILQLRAARG